MRYTHIIPFAFAALTILEPNHASAQSAIRTDCLNYVARASDLRFSHNKHRLWYLRYWNGKCEGLSKSFLSDGCSENEPGWNSVVNEIMRQAPPGHAGKLRAVACKLGALIGYEWAKDNNVRCIHTFGANSLGTLNAIIKQKGDVFERLRKVEAKAKSMCRALRPPKRK